MAEVMNVWLDPVAALLLAVGGAALGRWCSRWPGRWWLTGYVAPLVILLLFATANHLPTVLALAPFAWMIFGNNHILTFGVAGAMLLSTPLSRLPRRRDRIAVRALIGIIVAATVVPFLAAPLNQRTLAGLQTRLDGDGVCRQNTPYTCGPAAAVTALRRLSLPAEEGELALWAHTSSLTGTPPDLFARVLRRKYRSAGLEAEYRFFRSLDELKAAGLTLAILKLDFLIDHYVVVLEVGEREVVIGDPLEGLVRLSREQFDERWRYQGVVLRKLAIEPGASTASQSAPSNPAERRTDPR
jgi:MFS family permease